MNIRYRYKDAEGEVVERIFSLEQVEQGSVSSMIQYFGRYLSRDIGTGLKDRSQVEIFERDEVKYHNPYHLNEWVVVYDSGSFWFENDNGPCCACSIDDTYLEIIGREEWDDDT